MELASCHLCVLPASLKIYRQVSFYVNSYCTVSLQHDLENLQYLSSLYYIKNQQDATLAVSFISHCKITLHVSDAVCVHHQEY